VPLIQLIVGVLFLLQAREATRAQRLRAAVEPS
jgi:hypothetical protein